MVNKKNKNLILEKKFINLLLMNRNCLEKWLEQGLLDKDCFDNSFHIILDAIKKTYLNKSNLTKSQFLDYLTKNKVSNKVQVEQELLFSEIYQLDVDTNDFSLLMEKIFEKYLLSQFVESLAKADMTVHEQGIEKAIKVLHEEISELKDRKTSHLSNDKYRDISEGSKDFIQKIKDYRDGKIKEDPLVKCGIEEIDKTMQTGFAQGTLTLFCADVGCFKSSMMLNIAMNIWENGYNVLFVPLEMPEEQLRIKMLSRTTKIPTDKIFNKVDLTDKEVEKLEEAQEGWDNPEHRFYICEKEKRASVSAIEREILKHVDIFDPDLVVIDYIANLVPDNNKHSGRNDLEIGDMLKNLRQMGKANNFAVVSGAQLGREALKRIRKGGDIAVNSEDIRGSHEYAADADNIYAQVPDEANPNSRLQLFVVKARNGKKVFPNNKMKAVLEVKPEISYIGSIKDYATSIDEANILNKADDSFEFDIEDNIVNDDLDDKGFIEDPF